MRYLTALTLAATLLAAPASAATYTFSFDGNTDYPGTVSGEIGGLLDDGFDQQATSIFITSVTGSRYDFSRMYGYNFATPPIGLPTQQIEYNNVQRFNVANGAITLGEFGMAAQGLDRSDPRNNFEYYFCFFSSHLMCPGFLQTSSNGFDVRFVQRFLSDGPGVTFARLPDEPSPVPLPAGAGLLASALALMGFWAGRRKAA